MKKTTLALVASNDALVTNIGYTTLTKFKSFSIQVVMFGSSTGAAVPRIKNLRMIAT